MRGMTLVHYGLILLDFLSKKIFSDFRIFDAEKLAAFLNLRLLPRRHTIKLGIKSCRGNPQGLGEFIDCLVRSLNLAVKFDVF